MRRPKEGREQSDWNSFKTTFSNTIAKRSGGYFVGHQVLAENYVKGPDLPNPHCHSLTALNVRESGNKDSRIAVILVPPEPMRFLVFHSIVLSADATKILADTYAGKLVDGTYRYSSGELEIAAAWRFNELRRAADVKQDLDRLVTAEAALKATASYAGRR